MRKVLHLIPTLEGGGAERQLVMLAAEQATRGWDVHIALRRSYGVYAQLLRSSCVKVHELGDFRNLNPLLFLRISVLMQRIKPDLVQTWLPQMDVIGGAAALWNGVPLVLTERASKLAFQSFSLLTWLRKMVGQRAKAVVANSAAGVDYWRDILPIDALFRSIPNAVDVSAIRSVEPVSSHLIQKYQKLILVVGRLSYQKAVEVVLKAIPHLNGKARICVLIIGDGPLRQELERLVQSLNIRGSVLMLSFQSGWWGWLKNADALVSMSRYEGNPNVVLEAMAAGCPLIVSDIPEHREILTDASASFVPRENSVELAAAIERLFADLDSARKKSELAKSYVDHLTIQRVADAYEEVYASVSPRKVML